MSKIITIGREFGSGGRELGRKLAEKLQIAYYDHEIIREIASRTSLSEEYVKRIVDHRPIISFPIHTGRSFYPDMNPMFQQSIAIYTEQHKLLQELADKSDCLIVGRCADYILRDKNPLRIFVYAPAECKVRRCMEHMRENEENMTEAAMQRKITGLDRNRAEYYEYYTGQKWGSRENYDLMINTEQMTLDRAVDALASYIG